MKAQGVSVDLVQAYAWLSVHQPSETTRDKQRQFLAILASKLTASQLQRAQALAAELSEKIRLNSR